MSFRSLSDLHLNDLIRGGTFTPSPISWEDEVLYFLLVDRFSDGNEKGYLDLRGNVVTTGSTLSSAPATLSTRLERRMTPLAGGVPATVTSAARLRG